MFFGPLPLREAEGAILAHSVRRGAVSFKKGRILSAEDVAALRDAGLTSVTAARPGPDDVGEDAAAARIAAALKGPGVTVGAAFTGRVNLFADAAGLFLLDAERIDALNQIDESVTVATLPPHAPVEAGQMVATVKIIPFAAPRAAVEGAEASAGMPALRVAPFRALTAALIQTRLPGVKDSVLDKTVAVTRARLEALNARLVRDSRCYHGEAALADAIAAAGRVDLLLIAGASAITDRRDVLPAGIERAGGVIDHFGMPVDPGNLLLLARIGDTAVLGLPGCARSPKLNGFDWVLQRIAAGVPVERRDVMRMGVGGLLAEIPTRPLPRAGTAATAEAPRAPRIAALVLAAGRSSRMGGSNKLLAEVGGQPLVARTVEAALASQAKPVVVVTGHQAEAVSAALAGRPLTLVHNPDYADGLSASLKAGLAALPGDVDGVVVCLGDMPRVSPAVIDRLVAAYNPTEGRAVCIPTVQGKRGNPVLWDRGFFAEMMKLTGDAGAKSLLGRHADQVVEVPVDEGGILYDVDTPELLAELRGGEG